MFKAFVCTANGSVRCAPAGRPSRVPARALVLAFILLATACGDTQSQEGAAPAAVPSPATVPDAGEAAAPAATASGMGAPEAGAEDEAEVTVASGPWAGTYRYRGDLRCLVQESGHWSMYMAKDQARSVSFLNAVLDAPARGGRTERGFFEASFGHGDNLDRLDLQATDRESGGNGIVAAVERQGRGGVIRVSGTDAGGTQFSATVRCASVTVES
jgi:hypothetical protein